MPGEITGATAASKSGIAAGQAPVVLCIGGLDPSGGAGLLADARACAYFGAHALGVATALVPQNSRGVACFLPQEPEAIRAQIAPLLDDFRIAAVKIGLLPDPCVARVVARVLEELGPIPVVIDPVWAPTNGTVWNDEASRHEIAEALFSHATIVTPNLPEASWLTQEIIDSPQAMVEAAATIAARFGCSGCWVKGGHLANVRDPQWREGTATGAGSVSANACQARSDEPVLIDALHWSGANYQLRSPWRDMGEVRGTGCQVASALAALLAGGVEPVDAARRAQAWIGDQIAHSQPLGGGARMSVWPRGPL